MSTPTSESLGDVHTHDVAPPGAYWSGVVRRGQTIRIVDVDGAGAASLLAYNARQPSERYNAPDTTKVQNMIHLTAGWLLLSDLGRVLLSITADNGGGHETLCGASNASTVAERYGEGAYLSRRNERFANARDNFIAALGRHGLDRRDLVPSFNLFARVEVDEDGNFSYIAGQAQRGAWIDLRAELDVLIVLSATPHVLDLGPEYRPGRLDITVRDSAPAPADDLCRTRTVEARRAFAQTDAWFASFGPEAFR